MVVWHLLVLLGAQLSEVLALRWNYHLAARCGSRTFTAPSNAT